MRFRVSFIAALLLSLPTLAAALTPIDVVLELGQSRSAGADGFVAGTTVLDTAPSYPRETLMYQCSNGAGCGVRALNYGGAPNVVLTASTLTGVTNLFEQNSTTGLGETGCSGFLNSLNDLGNEFALCTNASVAGQVYNQLSQWRTLSGDAASCSAYTVNGTTITGNPTVGIAGATWPSRSGS